MHSAPTAAPTRGAPNRAAPTLPRWSALPALLLAAGTLPALAQTPTSLARASRPEPSNLGQFVADRGAAIALGKALFWDMRVGSDGKTACASCHFHAGADTRSKNQLSRGPNGQSFAFGGPNYQLRPSDFPFHQFADANNRDSAIVRSLAAVSSSQGVFRERFSGIVPGQAEDTRQVVYDPVFHVGAVNTRQVEPRNTPSVINAVFNLRNFWDGRAQTIFNGVNPWGKRDTGARVYRNDRYWSLLGWRDNVRAVQVTINDASLASQASGPPLSDLEMSAAGRRLPDLGRKMYALRPLAGQQVASDDSVLASRRAANGDGLSSSDYAQLVKQAFRSEWWNGSQRVTIANTSYSQTEANFSLFFGLALQMYQATLVSDRTPFDRFAEGSSTALTPQQLTGWGVFLGKGKCVNCHGGAAFTNASIHRRLITDRLNRMVMGDGNVAVYDEGFYNIGVTPTAEDRGVGGNDPFGNPLSFAGLAKKSVLLFNLYEQALLDNLVTPFTRISVQGSFKTPGLRNVELTAPYFHNGGTATLMQVVEFYNRGGNFARANIADLDADIQPLGLTQSEKEALVAFMKALTDDRVRKHAAPFDHPQLAVPNGHPGDTSTVTNDGWGRATDDWLVIPAVGRGGYSAERIPTPFLGLAQ
ncbi:MAG: cytochrome-c peroxidase [Burkholderiaceae bacterium]|nr:cytochrome-c peroxidase [Burkholderiaceae bacterium]